MISPWHHHDCGNPKMPSPRLQQTLNLCVRKLSNAPSRREHHWNTLRQFNSLLWKPWPISFSPWSFFGLCFMLYGHPMPWKKSHHTKPLYENMDWWPSPNNYGKTSHVLSMPHGLIHCVPLGDFSTIQILSTCYRPASSGSATRGMTFTNQACGVTLLELLSFPDFYQEKICFLNWSQKSRISKCKSSHLPWSMMIHGSLRQSNWMNYPAGHLHG